MNKRQKLVQEAFLNDEERIISRLKTVYNKSLDDITKKAKELQDQINALDAMQQLTDDAEEKAMLKSMEQSKIYQKQYQDALKKQINSILDNMQVEEFKTVDEYLRKCYEDGFIGTMYDLHGQKIPLIFPLDQEAMVRAVQTDSKISQGLYARLGEDVTVLKKKITAQVSRSISTGMTYAQTAQQLAAYTNIGFNNAVRIARTEGHRIQVQGTMDACYKAKDAGADVVKQWDSTLDNNTRESHQKVDGEIRELDKPFSNKLMFPGDPAGGAAEVVNCRCALLQRARWALDEDELKTLEERAGYFGLDKTENFDDFKEKYLKASQDASIMTFGDIFKEYEEHKTDIDKTVRKVEVDNKGLNHEVGTVIDRMGNVILVVDGEQHKVSVSVDVLKDNIMTHNHPNGGSFSTDDVRSFVEADMFELRATAPDGMIYSLRKSKAKTNIDIVDDFEDAVSPSRIYELIKNDFDDGVLTVEDAADYNTVLKYRSDCGEKWLKENAEKYGYIFDVGKV